MSIRAEQVMAAYAPLAQALDRDRNREIGADRQVNNANINFDQRIQKQALPISRMLNSDNTVNTDAIKSATPFSDPFDLWNELSANMPSNRGIDPMVFQEKYQMGKQMYDMNLANQVQAMTESGLSEKKIRNALKENPDLYDYALNNAIIPRENTGIGVGDIVKDLAIGTGGAIAAERLYSRINPVKPNIGAMRDLKAQGFKAVTENGKRVIRRRSAQEIAKDAVGDRRTNKYKDAVKEVAKKREAARQAQRIALNNNPDLQRAVKGSKSAIDQVISRGIGKPTITQKAIQGLSKMGSKGKIAAGLLGSIAATGLFSDNKLLERE